MNRTFAILLLATLILSACAPVSAPTAVPATGVAPLPTATAARRAPLRPPQRHPPTPDVEPRGNL